MHVRHINKQDYDLLSSWWKAQEFPEIPQELLPDTGLLVSNLLGIPVVAAYLYKTNSKVGWLEWTTANPEIRGIQRDLAFDVLFKNMINYGKDLGISIILTSVSNPSLKARMERGGAEVSDSGMTNLVWRL